LTPRECSLIVPFRPRAAGEGDLAPQSAWWRGRAGSAVMRNRRITTRARALRKEMTEPEVMLWSRLRGRGPNHITFRRQHPIGSLIVDFYCPSCRLAIEVDGNTHATEEAMWRDRARDHWLESQGIDVVRVSAAWVYRDLRGVVAAILGRAEQKSRLPLAPSTTRSSAGGPPPTAPRGR
jgi:very-short-patch-repair endonuclease